MRTFLIIWIGQFISMMGSKLSEYALSIWAYQQMQSFTQVAGLIALMYLPHILLSPLAGALVDRWNRRFAMILSDTISGLCTFVMMLLSLTNHLQLWHIYISVPTLAIATVFQTPAYSAAIAQLVPKQHHGRANGIATVPEGFTKVVTPFLAVFLLGIVKLEFILLVDCISFVVALGTLLWVQFPKISGQRSLPRKKRNLIQQLLRESWQSWRYIRARSSLFRLWMFIILMYFTIGLFDISFWMLMLKQNSMPQLGMVLSSTGVGILLGSALMSVWGGPKRTIPGILRLTLLQGLLIIALGLGVKVSIILAIFGVFFYYLADPIIMGTNRAIWQSKVPLNLQGRIFSLQLMIQRGAFIPAYLLAGVLVDWLFEPILIKSSLFKQTLGQVWGDSPGTGICLFLMVLGVFKILISVLFYRNIHSMNIESLPSHSQPLLASITNNTYP